MGLIKKEKTLTHEIITILGIIKVKKKIKTKEHNGLTIGEGTIFNGTVINPYSNKITIGKNSIISCEFNFESDKGEIEVGDRTFINSLSRLISRSKITIGNDVTVAWGCTFYDHNSHSLDWKERVKDIKQQLIDCQSGDFIKNKNWDVVKSRPIKVCDKAWIGMNCTILNGVTIGEGAIVGACSVVREDVEPWTVVAGNPAKLIKRLRHE